MLQNDRLSKLLLPPQEANSKPLTFENNPKKPISHYSRRLEKNNFNEERGVKNSNQSQTTHERQVQRPGFIIFTSFRF